MTQAHLERLCHTWQRRLRLQDWKVEIRLVPEAEMPEGHWAKNDWDDEDFTSSIIIQDDPDDLKIEGFIVHELLHLRLQELSHDPEIGLSYGDPRLERCINLLTDCFMQAYPRRTKEKKNGTTS